MERTGVQKNTNVSMNKNQDGNGEPSSSTSSTSMELSQGQNQSTNNKIEGENENKKMKREESVNSCEAGASQSQESSVEETTIDDLPPEMLMEILKFLDTPSLFDCRLVNRNWNEISSGMLRNRSKNFTNFEYSDGSFLWMKCRFSQDKKRSLSDFVTCIKNSKDSPFAQFYFLISDENTNPLQFFNDKDFKDFTSHFVSSNQRLKCLSLSFDYLNNIKMFQLFTPKLSDLLLKIPRLEELVFDFYSPIEAPHVKLFPIPKQSKSETNSNQVSIPVQLPNLKVLRFESPMILPYTEIFKDLLNAAINLKNISMPVCKLTDFQFLHSLGKLHLLKEAVIEMERDFFSATESDQNCALLPLPALEILDLRMTYEVVEISSRQAKFLGNLFESSKDTLTELLSEAVGLFPGLQLPTFTKLRKLVLTQSEYSPQQMFPPGVRARDVFPAVSQLDLFDFNIGAWESAFPQEDSIPLFPSLKMLSVCECNCTENAISRLVLMCPNLIELQIHRNDNHYCDNAPKLNLLKVGRVIWTHMKQLESLEIDVDVDLPKNNPTALDSCFTGISLENCQRLDDLKESNKALEKWGFQSNVPESLLNPQREHASILNMKDLKTLKINPYSGEKLLKQTDFFTKLTWISEEYAFNLMPHLKPEPEEED